MQTKYFSPSVNIQRDKDNSLIYIPTRNGEKAFHKIVSSFSHGTKSFNIIGAYGSGKSSFILALDKVLNHKADYFQNPFDGEIDQFETTLIVGEYASFKQIFIETFDIEPTKNIFNNLRVNIAKKAESKIGQLIVVDEFGKFLEYAAKENPEDELYFIQQLAEFTNTANLPILFITTLHQAFEDYALGLTKPQKKEWDKVKGRLVEISFNEPVEQLLFLASERISQKFLPCSVKYEKQIQLFEAIQDSDAFPMRDYFTFEFAQKLFPFDILSASIATLAFQRYGQNERSLFSFLESEDYLGINDFTKGNDFYHIAHIYDYLKYNFHSLVNSRFNPDAVQWKALDEAIQRAESIFDKDFEDAGQILKTIGLLSIFGRQGQKTKMDFLTAYAKIALGINNPVKIIDKLEQKQIIRYRNYSQRYVLFKGTDIDINLELEQAEGQVSKDFSIVHRLHKHFNFPIVPAKRIFFEKGTPRYFVYEITENPIVKIPEGQIDGFINLVFNPLLDKKKILEFSVNSKEAILFGWFQHADLLKDQLIEIEKIQIVKDKCLGDPIAILELNENLYSATESLNSQFHASFYGKYANVLWYFNGEEKHFKNTKELNFHLSEICDKVYQKTPKLLNELMNREKVSGAISTARNRLIGQLIESGNEINMGFDEDHFPPEKTIFLTLLQRTGIHQKIGNTWQLDRPTDTTYTDLWNVSEHFLKSCELASRKLTELIDILKSRPYKLKQGFIDFWVPIFIIAKQKHIAFYESGIFIPSLSVDTLEVAMKQPHKYHISTFNLSENRLNIFNRYRNFLNQIEENKPDLDTFIETVKPFLSFYKQLVPFTKQTKQLSKEAMRLREAISIATDPEKIFFEDIPRALGFTLKDFANDNKLEDFSLNLQSAIREISSAFPNLVNRIENVISNTVQNELVNFPENKFLLQQRFKELKKEQIEPKLRVLIQRINTPLEDRQSWVSSIATAIKSKPLDQFTDGDEQDFKINFPRRIHDLDNLTDISQKDIDESKEEILKLELTSFVKGVQRNLIRLPKEKVKLIDEKKKTIQKLLGINDRQTNIALLIKLLQEAIENE